MALLSILTVLFSPFFWIVVFLVYSQYKKIYNMQVQVLGEAKTSIRNMILNAIVIGMIGGIIATIIMMLLGVTIESRDFNYMLPIAILLMFINIRYICFSYAGGIIALSSLLFGVPQLNVSSIMSIVAILHLIESILIWIDGYKDATPIFLEHKHYGVIGGFMLQRFWPIPFAILFLAFNPLQGASEIHLPDWWPLFKTGDPILSTENISLQISAVIAALGYGDMALSSSPQEKCKKSSKRLFIYSMLLLIFSVLSTYLHLFKFIAAVFAPSGHEFLILYGQKEENKAEPIFRQYSRGITILDIKKGQPAANMGLKPGYIITKMNHYRIDRKEDMHFILSQFPPYIWIEAIDRDGKTKIYEYQNYQTGISSLGIVVVPKYSSIVFNMHTSMSMLKKLLDKMKTK
jgi:hypothetical protein